MTDEATRLGEALMPEFLRLRALGVPIRGAVLGALAKHESLTGDPPAEGTDGARSSTPDVRAVAVTEPAQGGDWAALGRASNEESTRGIGAMSEERAEGFWWVRVREGVHLPWGGTSTVARVFEEFGKPWPRQVLVLGVDATDGAAWYTDPESAEQESIAEWGPYIGKEPETLESLDRKIAEAMASYVPVFGGGPVGDCTVTVLDPIDALHAENENLKTEIKRLKDALGRSWEYEVDL